MAEENYDDENRPQPKPFPPDMVEDLESKTVAEEVRGYLWQMEPIYYENVSAQMKRELVSRFVDFEMPNLPPENFRRVRILADFYNLTENLSFIESLLNKNETKPTELDRSIYSTIILWEIGNENQKKRALQYYEYMVGHRFANENFTQLLECLAVFGNDTRPNSLQARMEKEVKNLAARETTEDEAGMEKRHIEGLLNNEFFIIEEANKARARISQINSLQQRLFELIKAYLYLTDDDGGDYFLLWTHQQIRRIAEREGKEKIIEDFRTTVKRLNDLPVGDKKFCKVRSYNAMEFFLGQLNAEEKEFMDKNRNRQVDPLHLIVVPFHNEDPMEKDDTPDEDEMESENET